MAMLAAPDTITGPLTDADLDRETNTGRIYRLHRATMAGRDTCSGARETRSGCDCSATQCPPCHGMCQQGRHCNADACAPEGGRHADPVLSGTHHHSLLSRAWLRLVRWMA